MQPTIGSSSDLPGHSRSKLIIIILAALLFLSLVFGFWAFGNQQSYKTTANSKIASAEANAQNLQKENQDLKTQLSQPYNVYSGSTTFGTITFNYPRNYSAYVDSSNAEQPIEGYFYPQIVPGIQSGTAFALRVELVSTSYSQVLTQFNPNIQQGKATAVAYIPTKMKSVKNVQPGTLITGQVGQDSQGHPQTGAELVIPVRDKTLQIYTQSNDFMSDFNNIVLSSLTFIP